MLLENEAPAFVRGEIAESAGIREAKLSSSSDLIVRIRAVGR